MRRDQCKRSSSPHDDLKVAGLVVVLGKGGYGGGHTRQRSGRGPTVCARCCVCSRHKLAQRRPPANVCFLGHCWKIGKDRKSTRLNSSHLGISYAVFWLK